MPTTPRKIPAGETTGPAELARLLERAAAGNELETLLAELFTPRELHDLALRLRLLRMLCDGVSQRKITAALGISLCKITRGSRLLKNPDSAVKKLLQAP
jgi:TrpR family trp operon transcriptional repressor